MAAGAQELETLIVRLTADAADYIKAMKDAERQTAQSAVSVQEEADRMEAAVQNTINSMQSQLETFGMSSREAELYRLSLSGATDEQMFQAASLQEQISAMEEQAQAMARGEQITQSVATQEERRAQKTLELNDLLGRGAITQETYNRALGELYPKAEKAADAMSKLTTALTGAAAALGLSGTMWASFNAFSEEEKILNQLTAVMEVNGREVESLRADYQEFAAEIQKTTTMGDEAALSLVKQAESFNLTGEAAKRAVKDAIAFAAINGSSAEAMIRVTAAMAQGDTERAMIFSRMIPQLRGVRDETEFLARYQKLVAAGQEAANKEMETASGRLKQLKNDFGDFLEMLGKIIADALIPMVSKLRDLVAWLQKLPDWLKKTLVALTALVAVLVTLTTVGPLVIAVLTAIVASVKALGVAIMTSPLTGWIVLIGLAITAVVALTRVAREAGNAITGMSDAMKKNEESIKNLNDIMDKYHQSRIDAAKALPSSEQRKAQLEEELKGLEKNLEASKKYLEQEQKKYAKNRGVKDFVSASIYAISFTSLDVSAGDREALKDAEVHVEKYRERLSKVKEEISAIKQAEQNRITKLVGDSDLLIKKLREEIQTVGMTTDEIELFRLSQAAGADATTGLVGAQLELVEALMAEKKAALEVDQVKRRIIDLNDTLQAQIDNFGKSAEEVDISRLEAEAKRLGVAISADELRFKAKQLQGMREFKQLEDRAKAITKENLTPIQKFNDIQTELNTLLEKGLITEETFAAAIKKAKDEMTKLKEEVMLVDAVSASSAEAVARISDYRARLREAGTDGASATGPGAVGILKEIRDAIRSLEDNASVILGIS